MLNTISLAIDAGAVLFVHENGTIVFRNGVTVSVDVQSARDLIKYLSSVPDAGSTGLGSGAADG